MGKLTVLMMICEVDPPQQAATPVNQEDEDTEVLDAPP